MKIHFYLLFTKITQPAPPSLVIIVNQCARFDLALQFDGSIIRSMLLELQGTWMSIQGTWMSGLSLYDSIYKNTLSSHTKFSGNVKSYQNKLRMKFETELLKNECEILKKVKVYLFAPSSFIFQHFDLEFHRLSTRLPIIKP